MTLPAPGEKAAVVQAMFDRIAPHYDRMNRLLTFGLDQRWRRRTLDRIALRRGERVLDLACGTGDFAEMCRGRGARVVATDYAARMLDHADRRGMHGILVRGDAMRMPFRSAAFDALVCGFALRNFADLPTVFAEMARVLKPGGRLGIVEVDRPDSAFVRFGHSLYFDRVVPLVGRLLADRKAYAYLPESTAYLPPWDGLAAGIAAAGFESVARERAMFGAVQIVTARRRTDAAVGGGARSIEGGASSDHAKDATSDGSPSDGRGGGPGSAA